MLKRLLSIILLFSLLLTIIACTNSNKTEGTMRYYYLRSDVEFDKLDGVIASEPHKNDLNANDYSELIRIYLSGPHSDVLRSPFPPDIHLISLTKDSSMIIVTLSNNFADLSGLDLTLACVCLGMTAMEITSAESVRIQTENIPLDGKMSVTINRASIQLFDDHEQYINSTES